MVGIKGIRTVVGKRMIRKVRLARLDGNLRTWNE